MLPTLLVNSDLNTLKKETEKILLSQNLSLNHPNVLLIDEEKLGVEVAQKIHEHLSLKPYQKGLQSVIVWNAQNFTPQAQNSLLKILEDPPAEVLIILGSAAAEALLPTIVSRCQVINLKSPSKKKNLAEISQTIENLTKLSKEECFVFIEKLKDPEEFLEDLLIYYQEASFQLLNDKNHDLVQIKQVNKFLKILLEAQRWSKQNVNLRAILEYLMLEIPEAK